MRRQLAQHFSRPRLPQTPVCAPSSFSTRQPFAEGFAEVFDHIGRDTCQSIAPATSWRSYPVPSAARTKCLSKLSEKGPLGFASAALWALLFDASDAPPPGATIQAEPLKICPDIL